LLLIGRVASTGKTIRESTQNLVGKPEEVKPCTKYVSVGGRAILKCILRNGALGYEVDASVSG
jgi:hypothetical protein